MGERVEEEEDVICRHHYLKPIRSQLLLIISYLFGEGSHFGKVLEFDVALSEGPIHGQVLPRRQPEMSE